MKLKKMVALILGIIAVSVITFWPVRSMALMAHIGSYSNVIMGDDDDDKLPPPPYTVPSPEGTQTSNG